MSKLAVVLLALGMLAGVVQSSRIADLAAPGSLSHALRAGEGVPLPVVMWHGECIAHGSSPALQMSLPSFELPLAPSSPYDTMGRRLRPHQRFKSLCLYLHATAASAVPAATVQAWETAAAAWAASAALRS
jgi:hypothetical protein